VSKLAVNDIGKMGLLALAMVCLTVARITNTLAEPAFYGLMGAIIGYLIGNGVNAVRSLPGSPTLVARGAEPALLVAATGDRVPVASVAPEPVPAGEPLPLTGGWPVGTDEAPNP
jgi:hypothetical protein